MRKIFVLYHTADVGNIYTLVCLKCNRITVPRIFDHSIKSKLRIPETYFNPRGYLSFCLRRRSLLCIVYKQSRTTKTNSMIKFRDPRYNYISLKEEYLSMPLSEKRTHYVVEPVTLDQVLPWPMYWKQNYSNIKKCNTNPGSDDSQPVPRKVADSVSVWEGNITRLEIDAIVNATNSSLEVGGGVDGSIHRAAGEWLKMECKDLKGCPVGKAKLTGGYNLPAKYVIQTVGPQGEIPEKLQESYRNSLILATENNIRTVAFPCISTGIYRYPQAAAAEVAISTVQKFLLENPNDLDRVIFCVYLRPDKKIYEELMQKYFGYCVML